MNKRKYTYILLPLMLAVAFLLGVFSQRLLHSTAGRSEAEKKLANILNIIDNQYVDPVDLDSLLEATYPTLLTNLDPHSIYIPASELQSVNDELEGSFSGVGIQFSIISDTVYVNEVVPGGPSEEAGLVSGDQIIEVDGENVAGIGITNERIMKLLKGESGSKVNLTVKRRFTAKPLSFTVERGEIPVSSVDSYYMATPTIGYIRVNKFGRNTYDEFKEALDYLSTEGAEDFIVDLRDNGGGYMEVAALMVNEFFGPGQAIVKTKGRDEQVDESIHSDGYGQYADSKVVVLIDEFSASASEIFAGAIQDNDRGLIVGRRSFGKGLVQRQIDLPDGSAIRLTIARYYTPSGRCIQKDYSDSESYENDLIDRYARGEAFVQDSIHLENLEKFSTRSGRTVYGGGGIMPDIFVPNDTTAHTPYYTRVANANILQPFALSFVDANYQNLSQSVDLEDLNSRLPSDFDLLSNFVEYAYRNAGINRQWAYINKSAPLLISQIKALIARHVLGFEAFIEELNKDDSTVNRAIDEIQAGKANFPLK